MKMKPRLGIWSIIPSPTVLEVLGRSGLDFAILDMEHGPYDISAVAHAILACENAGMQAFVRVPSLSTTVVQSVLDVGATGIVVPRIANLGDAKDALACMHYPPEGTRGFNPFTRAFRYNPRDVDLAQQRPYACLILEEQRAVNDLPAILRLPLIDALYIGVYDLSVSCGLGGDVAHPRITSLVRELSATIRAAGKDVGLMVRSEEECAQAYALGASLIVWGVDTFLLRAAAEQAVESFRRVIGDGD